jgi:hypothetical protein
LKLAEIAHETNKVKNSLEISVSNSESKKPGNLRTEYYELLNIGQKMNPLRLKVDQFPIESAIVIFEKPKSRDVCLYAYREHAPIVTVNGCKRVPLEFLFRGHYHLTVSEPPEPFAIYWDNYHLSYCRTIVFGTFILAMSVLFLAVTVGFAYALQK